MNTDTKCSHKGDIKSMSQKSIFGYMTDSSMYVNPNECNHYSPPFLAYIPTGVPEMNIDIETDLRGINRHTTKCVDCKHKPEKISNATNQFTLSYVPNTTYPHNKKECTPEYNIYQYNSQHKK